MTAAPGAEPRRTFGKTLHVRTDPAIDDALKALKARFATRGVSISKASCARLAILEAASNPAKELA